MATRCAKKCVYRNCTNDDPTLIYYESDCGNNHENDCENDHENDHENEHSKGGRAVLRCGSGCAGPLPMLGSVGLMPTAPTPVGSVSIDTTGLKKPNILLSVTGIINAPIGALPNLTFRILKCCDGCSQPVGGSYTYAGTVDLLESNSFAFQYCDCAQHSGCATYTLEITSATLAQAGTTINTTISALAVEN